VSNTKPFTEAHAIASVDFGLIFQDELPDKDRRALAMALTDHLKQFTRTEGQGDGVVVFRRKGEGEDDVAEEVHVHKDFVHAITFDYRGWLLTRNDLVDRLAPVIDKAREGELEPSSMGLTFHDVFVNDDPSSYSPSEVFTSSSFLPEFVFEAGGMWRQSLQWDDVLEANTRNFLAIEARNRPLEGDEEVAHFTEITHSQRLSGNQVISREVEWSYDSISRRLDHAHRRNKVLLMSLLSQDMIERIGLKEGS
jgi:hypothetical protein